MVFVFTDVNLDDVQAIKLLLKYSDKLDVGGLVPVCTGWCNMGPAIQNLFGLLSFMNRDDVPVWAGDAYALSEQTSGLYGCTYERSIPLYHLPAALLILSRLHSRQVPASRSERFGRTPS